MGLSVRCAGSGKAFVELAGVRWAGKVWLSCPQSDLEGRGGCRGWVGGGASHSSFVHLTLR